MSTSIKSYREWLRERLEQVRQKKPMFSLRAMAAGLKISPASLSQIISGKRPLSKKIALRLADYFSLSEAETKDLLFASLDSKKISYSSLKQIRARDDLRVLTENEFAHVSEWYHYAVLALSRVKGNRADPEWVSERLGISLELSKRALDQLLKLNLIIPAGKGFRQSPQSPVVGGEVPNASIRRFHHQLLGLADSSLEKHDVSVRQFGSLTFAIQRSHLSKAKKTLNKFQHRFWKMFQSDSGTDVYALGLQFFPLTNVENKK